MEGGLLKDYAYETNCVSCENGDDINAMRDVSRNVTYRTMLCHCAGLRAWAKSQGYAGHPRSGLHLKHDWHVSYHKSTWRGKRCYYLVWSGIEFIWVEKP